MAFVTNMPQEDEEKQAPSQGSVQPGGAAVSLAPSNGVGGAGAPSGAPAANNPNAGGSFATLDKYVNANQGQAEPLAGKITAGINDQFNTLQGQNTQTLNDIQGQVDQGYTKADPNLIASESANPVSFAKDANNVTAFGKQLTDQFNGPSSAESTSGFQNQSAKLNNAISTGKSNTGTEAGRENLLKGVETTPTTGVTALNSAILSQDPNAQSKVENAYQPFNGLVDQFNSGAKGIDTNITSATKEAQGANAAANAAIAKQTGDLQTGITNATTKAAANAKAYQDYVNNIENQGTTAVNKAITGFETNNPMNSFGPGDSTNPNLFNNLGIGAVAPGPDFNTTPPTTAQSINQGQIDLGSALSTLTGGSFVNPLEGITPQSYNPINGTLPTIAERVAPEVNPLERFTSSYLVNNGLPSDTINIGNSSGYSPFPAAAPAGTYNFGANSPTETINAGNHASGTFENYANLLQQLSAATAINPQDYQAFLASQGA